MNLLRNLRVDFRRAFCSKLFLIGLFCAQGVLYMNIPWDNFSNSILYIVEQQPFGSFQPLLLVCGTIPFATAYISDCENNFIKSLVIRSDLRSYLRSKAIVTAASCFVTIFLAKMMFVLVLHAFCPVCVPSELQPTYQSAMDRLLDTHPYGYLFAEAAVFAFAASAFALFALLLSSFTHNAFVTVMSPMVTNFFLTSLEQIFSVPAAFSVINLMYGDLDLYADNYFLTFLHLFWFWLMLMILFGSLFIYHAEKRFCHG